MQPYILGPFLYNKLHHYWLITEFRTLVIGCVSPHNASVTNKRLLQNLNTLSIHSLNCWIKLNFLPSYFTLNNSWKRHTAGLQITFNIHSTKKIQNFNLINLFEFPVGVRSRYLSSLSTRVVLFCYLQFDGVEEDTRVKEKNKLKICWVSK